MVYLDKKQLTVTTWQRSASTLMCDRWTRRAYSRKKNQFVAQESKEEAAVCESGCYRGAAAQVLSESVPQEQVLAIVVVLPSFSLERAYILGRDREGLFLIRREFTRKLWSELGVFRSRKTADEGLALARSIPIATSRVTASAEDVQALFNGLNLITPRAINVCRDCALMVDGRSFHLWLGKEPPFRVTDVSEPKYRSENHQALRWVYKVMAAAGDK
jgi:hypothetical protein